MFTKITETDLANKGVTGLPDTPNLSTMEMQAKFDELAKDVVVPKFNNLVDELDEKDLDNVTHSEDITDFKLDADGRMQVSTDGGETYGYAGSTGHQIMDGSGTRYPARANLQFSQNVSITDYDEENGNKTFLSVVGEKGERGDGATIRVGTVESANTPSIENVGSLTDAIFNFKLPKGDDGDSATIAVGSVTKGENPSVYNSGTSSNAVFNFVLPKGDKGDTGQGINILGEYETLAELQLAHPTGQRGDAYMVGTDNPKDLYAWDIDHNQWINQGALQGAKGDTGNSATVTIGSVSEGQTMAVENVGTSTDAILNFTLKKGDKGDQGDTGTISVGTVTGGETASVTNVGTPTNAIFNFVIPKGEKGDQGSPTVINGKSGANVTLYGTDIYTSNQDGAYTVSQEISNLHTEIAENGGGSIIRVTFDEEQSGDTITFAIDGMDTITKVVPSVEPRMIEISTKEMGVMTITDTTISKSITLTIDTYELYTVPFASGFDYQEWLTLGNVSGTYASLEEVLADEKALRQLFTKHASVDYLVECCSSDLDENVETIINTDLCAKWINLRDYALDTLYANTYIASAMDTADKYFYGEWAICVPNVPTLSDNTNVIKSSEANATYAGWKVFDNDASTYWQSNSADNEFIGYHFSEPKSIGSYTIGIWSSAATQYMPGKMKLQGSNDGTTYVDISEQIINNYFVGGGTYTFNTFDLTPYEYVRLYINSGTSPYGTMPITLASLQFNSWGAKGNVPIMTSNSAPYGTASASSASSGNEAYKAFDGKDSTDYSYWSATSGSNQHITYKFVTPICVKSVSFIPYIGRVKNYKVQASNDGFVNDTHDLTEVLLCGQSATRVDININNSNEYLYYRLFVVNTHESNIALWTLQFYGRELKVSVPKMDSNTSPFGEAFGENINSGNEPWKAFDNDGTTFYRPTTQSGSVGYDFGYSVKAKMALITIANTSRVITSGKVQGYDGSAWNNLADIPSISTTTPYAITIDGLYDKYRVSIEGNSSASPSVAELQFFGLDYSEHEERHWIYDHGIELETIHEPYLIPIGASGTPTMVKGDNSISASDNSTSTSCPIITNESIDLSDYTLMRCVLPNIIVSQGRIGVGDTISLPNWYAFADNSTLSLPNNCSVDITSVSSGYLCILADKVNASGGRVEVTEWWVE